MVREVRFAWDDHRPLPTELTHRGWDCDDPSIEPEDLPAKKPSRRRNPDANQPKKGTNSDRSKPL